MSILPPNPPAAPATAAPNATQTHSLNGIRVLDLSRVLAGPWCTQTLADLGADVIKIERPPSAQHPGGDDTRAWGPPYLIDASGQATAEAAYYLGCNRNKRSVTCDISQAAGRDLVLGLLAHCDVLVENFKVGDLARYGLDYASLAGRFPKLIYCSITGFGQTGPYKDRAGYDYAVQGMGGLMSVTGERDGATNPDDGTPVAAGPQKVGVAVADLFTGMYATVAILAALRHVQATGLGQHIDMALLDTQVAMLANLGANYLVSSQVPTRAGNAHQNIVPYQVFESAPRADLSGGASQPQQPRDHFIVAVGNDGQFAKFCDVIGQPALCADARFAKNADRVRNRGVLVPLLQVVLKTRPKADWLAALEARGVPCGAINNLDEVFADPQVQARDMVQTWDHPHHPAVRLVASPMKLSRTPPRQRNAPPLLGQHTGEVLEELLELSQSQIAALNAQGAV